MRAVPQKVQPIKKIQTDPQPNASWRGPTANKPTDAVTEPVPLIRPVTVPRDLLLPRTEGCDAKSAATAEVMMLLGLHFFVNNFWNDRNKVKERKLLESKSKANFTAIQWETSMKVWDQNQLTLQPRFPCRPT